MKKFLVLLLSLVSMVGYAQDLRIDKEQVESPAQLGRLGNGDIVMLSSVDERTPGHYFNPGTLHKNEAASLENLMVISNASWDEESKTLSCRLMQKSSGKFLTQDLGTLAPNASEAFEFHFIFRAPSDVENAMAGEDTDMTVSVTDGGSNYLNSQGADDDTPCAWKGGTANWSVWYLWKATGVFKVISDQSRYYIKTQGSVYNSTRSDFYYSSKSDTDRNVYFKSEPTGDNEIWECTVLDMGHAVTWNDASSTLPQATVMLRNAATGMYLGTDPVNKANPRDDYQSREDERTIVLSGPTVTTGMNSVDASLFLIISWMSGESTFNPSSGGDRFLVYGFDAQNNGQTGTGMYFSNETNHASYGLVYRLYDVESGLPIALPAEVEETIPAIDLFQQYVNSVQVPSFREGNEPGCVKDYEHAMEVVMRFEELRALLDDPDIDPEDDDFWRKCLKEAKALVEEWSTFEFLPMVPGYYRFISSFPGFEQQQGVEKAMSAKNWNFNDGSVRNLGSWDTLDMGTPEVDEETGEETGEILGLNQVWEVTEGEDGHLYVKNMYWQNYFTNANTQSGYIYMGSNPQWVEFAPTGSGDFNLLVEGKGYALHCGGHSSGAGEASYLVGWNGGAGSCSAWFCRPTTMEELEEIFGKGIEEQAKITAQFTQLKNDVTAALTRAKRIDNTLEGQIINSVDQISSPATEPTEGSLAALIDENFTSYWHSNWSDNSSGLDFGSDEQMEHYLQFDLLKEYQNIVMRYACRINVGNDKPASFSITASNDEDGDFEEVATIDAVGSTDNTYYSYEIDLTAPYRYIRVRATNSTTVLKRGYWHASEMNFFETIKQSPDLFAKTGDVGVALEDALAAAEEVTRATQEDIDALQAAYDAFLAVFTNPDELEELIEEGAQIVRVGGVGTGVAQKNAATTFSALESAIESAEKFLEESLETCTKAELEAQTEPLQKAIDAWNAVEPNKLSAGVWYYIQCPTEVYKRIGYNPVENNSYYETGTSLCGARVAVGNANEEDVDLTEDKMRLVPTTFFEAEDVKIGEEDNVAYSYTDACAQWRFIEAGDGKYYIQNRATGLFMPTLTAKAPGMLNTSYIPGAFQVAYYNGGVVNLVGNYVDSDAVEGETCLHMQTANAVVVGWPTRGDNGLNNGSSWEIVKVADVEAGYVQKINLQLDGMKVRGLTLPYDIDPSGMENVDDVEVDFITEIVGIDAENGAVGCNTTFETIKAGTPMFVFTGDNGDEPSLMRIPMGDKFTWTVDNSGDIQGTLENYSTMPAGAAIPGVNTSESNYNEGTWGSLTTIAAAARATIGSAWLVDNSNSYIDADEADYDQYLVLDASKGSVHNAIDVVKGDDGKVTVVYNLNGQRVSSPVKGLFILNGKKVFIK